MKLIKIKITILIYSLILQIIILLVLSKAFCSNDIEYYKEVLMYGTDSDIVDVFNNVRNNLGEDVNKLILKLFNEDHDIRVYKAAINYIKINKIKSAKNILLKELNRKPIGEDYEEDIIIALSEINATESLKTLINIFEKKDVSPRIKLDIIDALGKLGDSNEEVENILINTVRDKKNNNDIRAHAILSLGKIKSKNSVALIKKILFNNYEKEIIRMYSVVSLKEIEGINAIKDLSKLIKDKSPKVAEYAVRALSDINSEKVGDILIKALRSDYDSVRYYAILGLQKIKYKKANKILEFKARYDSNPNVRKAAEDALKEIKEGSKTDELKSDKKDDVEKVGKEK